MAKNSIHKDKKKCFFCEKDIVIEHFTDKHLPHVSFYDPRTKETRDYCNYTCSKNDVFGILTKLTECGII